MLRAALFALLFIAAPLAAEPVQPKAALDELVGAERKLSDAAANLSPAEGITSLLADDALLYTRGEPVRGKQAAAASLSANPSNRGTHASWRSIRAGVSADGQHGFTLGYLDVNGGEAKTARRRYLAYWIRGAEGWRVVALKQLIRAEGEADAPAQPAALPRRGAAPEPANTAAHKASLMAAEKAFSDRAQVVGVRQAFREKGRPDAINLFGKDGFVIGLKAIGENPALEPGDRATIHWSADDAIVASSGDLGVTFGTIRPNASPEPGQPDAMPFFTVWMRDDPSKPWRYVAE